MAENLSAADGLTNAPQPGAVPRLTAEQVCQLGWHASNQLTRAERFVIQWSQRDLADEIMPPAASRAVLAHPAANGERDSRMAELCAAYRTAVEHAEPHKRTVSAGELTYVRALERLAPPRPGKVAGNKFEYQRYGMWSL